MITRNRKKKKTGTTISDVSNGKLSAFHARFCPYADQLYRSALIVTGDRRSANTLGVEIYKKALTEYLQGRRIVNFRKWLVKTVSEYFSKSRRRKLYAPRAGAMKQRQINLLYKICKCLRKWPAAWRGVFPGRQGR